jgi:hypothetical protein
VLILKGFNILTIAIIRLFMGCGVLFGLMVYISPQVFGFQIGRLSNLFGALSVSASFAAVIVWIVRKIYIQVKKRSIPDFELTKVTLLFLRKHHISLGWLAIMVATAHGVYWLLRYPNFRGRTFTGLTAWVTLALLVVFGACLDYRIKVKILPKKIRLYHITLAIVFIVAMFLHI